METKAPFHNPQRSPTEDREYRLRAAAKIMMLSEPVKMLSTSRLMNLKASQLDEIGKAARQLNEVLDRAGMVRK